MKKTIFALLFFSLSLPATFAGKVLLPFFDDIQLHYVHINEDKKVSSYSTEFHLKDKKYHYLYIKLYSIGENGEKKPPHIHRLSVFNLQKELVYFYDKNLKSNKTFFNHYAKDGDRYYRKEDKKKWQIKKRPSNKELTLEKFVLKLKEKVLQKKFDPVVWNIYIPYSPVNNVKIRIHCRVEKENPYFLKDEAVIICKSMPKSKAIRFLVGEEKSRNIFAFQQGYPHYILEVITGEKYFYITEKKTILLQDREKLLQEIDAIKKKISNIKNERF